MARGIQLGAVAGVALGSLLVLGYTSELCSLLSECNDRLVWLIVCSAVSVLILILAALALGFGPDGAKATAVRAASLLLLALWAAGLGWPTPPAPRLWQHVGAVGSVLAVGAAGVFAADSWSELFP
eukprot:TRINITY_DN1458_c0_g1_i3.p2 TRINITY_DN1458_c0_g1~~TRINITY_DN1458_c0_g1_i3.p2  ORF type:complete len:126 (-),score=38.53 TRINITY_DN1458_c0_g1_i3:134-511(-)